MLYNITFKEAVVLLEHLLVDKNFHGKNVHNIQSKNYLHWALAYARDSTIQVKELYLSQDPSYCERCFLEKGFP